MTKENELIDLYKELQRQAKDKIDYILDQRSIKTSYDVGTKTIKLELDISEHETEQMFKGFPISLDITDHCHNQIAQKTNIPMQYYKRLRESHPELLKQSINTLIQTKDKLMVRTLDGKARALLSNRYRPIDNYDVMKCTLDNLNKVKQNQNIDIKIIDARLTETRLYVKTISKQITGQIDSSLTSDELDSVRRGYGRNITRGDIVYGGIIISNSEVGSGRFRVEPFMHVCVCSNGLISDKALSRVHLGTAKDTGIINFSDETLALDDLTLYSKLSDMIQQTFTPAVFQEWLDRINKVASTKILKPILAVNHVVKQYQLPEKTTEDLLAKFTDYGHTQWGLSQAITDLAHNQDNYEKQIEMEKAGARLLNKPLTLKEVQDEQ